MVKQAVYVNVIAAIGMLAGCGFYSDDDCDYGGGSRGGGDEGVVYDPGLRNPASGQCEYGYFGGGGGGSCDACGNCPPAGDFDGDRAPTPTWGYCDSECTGLEEGTCLETSGCRAIYASDCADTRCEDTPIFSECWPTDTTGPIQGGSCDGLSAFDCSLHDDCSAVHQRVEVFPDEGGNFSNAVGQFGYCIDENGECEGADCGPGHCAVDGEEICEMVPPDCPVGTTPGIHDNCYTGYCIPLEACDNAPACAAIATEILCIMRPDCAPIYQGIDCTCDGDECTCAEWLFEECEA